MGRSLLIVDDDPRIRTSLAGVVLADLKMPGMSGLDLLRLLRQRMPDVDVVLMTAYEDLPTVAEAMREGAVDFLVKPLEPHQLRRLLDRIFEDRAAREAARWDESVPPVSDRLVGRDPRMVEIFKLVGQVAATRTNVVIRGESGTGKDARLEGVNSWRSRYVAVRAALSLAPSRYARGSRCLCRAGRTAGDPDRDCLPVLRSPLRLGRRVRAKPSPSNCVEPTADIRSHLTL